MYVNYNNSINNASNFGFSNNNIFWELFVILLALEVHAFSLYDQRCLLLVDHSLELILDFLITCGSFSNDEVEEDDTCDDNNYQPNEPV